MLKRAEKKSISVCATNLCQSFTEEIHLDAAIKLIEGLQVKL